MKTAEFIFVFDSNKEARVVSKSLDPEIKHEIPKTNVDISLKENKIFLKITADDISSLRAACNSYLRWISVALDVEKTV